MNMRVLPTEREGRTVTAHTRTSLDEYQCRYQHAALERQDGIIIVRLHSDGGPLIWGAEAQGELGLLFADIAADPDNRIVVLTGSGDRFMTDVDSSWLGPMTPEKWDTIQSNGRRLLVALLSIPVPVIAAVNGPASVHAEVPLLSDLIVVAEGTYFQDAPHFALGVVPGDGVHVVWPMLLGPNRARHFLLTSARIGAKEAHALGLVGDVVPADQVLTRALAYAGDLAKRHDVVLRATRDALTADLRHRIFSGIGHGLALEGLGSYASWPGDGKTR